jgi:hypothetical protein
MMETEFDFHSELRAWNPSVALSAKDDNACAELRN